jgi:hypothetical protein
MRGARGRVGCLIVALVSVVVLAGCGGPSTDQQVQRAVSGLNSGGSEECNYLTPAEIARAYGRMSACRASLGHDTLDRIIHQTVRVSGSSATDDYIARTDHYYALLEELHGRWLVDRNFSDKADITQAVQGLYGTRGGARCGWLSTSAINKYFNRSPGYCQNYFKGRDPVPAKVVATTVPTGRTAVVEAWVGSDEQHFGIGLEKLPGSWAKDNWRIDWTTDLTAPDVEAVVSNWRQSLRNWRQSLSACTYFSSHFLQHDLRTDVRGCQVLNLKPTLGRVDLAMQQLIGDNSKVASSHVVAAPGGFSATDTVAIASGGLYDVRVARVTGANPTWKIDLVTFRKPG